MEDFEANAEVSVNKILCKLKHKYNESIHPPKALFRQISMIVYQHSFKSAIYLSKLLF